jgi:hypothetical protein
MRIESCFTLFLEFLSLKSSKDRFDRGLLVSNLATQVPIHKDNIGVRLRSVPALRLSTKNKKNYQFDSALDKI